MRSTRKSRKLSKEQNVKRREDMISNLPNNLISHILSFLPTKHAVATSVLSTRWKQFWTLITSLDFDDKLFLHPQTGNNSVSLQAKFTCFLYRVIHKVSCLHKFRLKCCQSYDVSHVSAWVAAILIYHIQELELSIPMEESAHVLPRNLFSCKTLVVLKLGTEFVMNVPISVCLPSLKTLHLDTVIFLDDDSIKRLLLGCPVLDELSMRECVGEDTHVVHIVAPLLTKLSVFVVSDDDYEYDLMLDTPALQYVKMIDLAANVCLVKELCHLIKADIGVGLEFHEPHTKAITDLLIGISKVQCLHVHNHLVQAIQNCNPRLPMFHNLTKLELGVRYFLGWELLFKFLEKSPCLENLVYYEGYENGFYEEDEEDNPLRWYPPLNVPPCLLFHLKVVEIWLYQGTEEELKMVEYFLKNAEVLEKLIIHSERLEVDQVEVTQEEVTDKLLMFQRASRTCQVEHMRSRKLKV